MSLGYMPKSVFSGSYDIYMFNFIRNCQDVFQSGCTILYSYQLCMSEPVPLHPSWYLLLSLFFILATLYIVISYC